MFGPSGPTLLELARQALSSTERGYDLLASKFDATPFRTPEPIVSTIVDAVGPPGAVSAGMDVCCGTGAVLDRLRSRCRDRVVGLDFSAGMLAQAAARSAIDGARPRLELVRADARTMTYDAEFDVATCAGAFGHFDGADGDAFLDSVRRALRPGGAFVFATSERPAVWSRAFFGSKGFNAAMRVRNWLIRPRFVMYYLTFTWPSVASQLARHGFGSVVVSRRVPGYSGAVVVRASRG